MAESVEQATAFAKGAIVTSLTVRIASSVAGGLHCGTAMLVTVNISLAWPGLLNPTVVTAVLGLPMVTFKSDGLLLTTVQAIVPFDAVPFTVKVCPGPGPPGPGASSQTAWSAPALASGFAFTVRVTSELVLPQAGFELVTVRRKVTVPTLLRLTVVSSLSALPIITPRSVGLLLTMVQAGVPFWAVPSMLKVCPGPGLSSQTT